MSGVINQINDISATIAAAVEEQSATSNEMMRNTSEAAGGAGDIAANIAGVTPAADGTLARAQESQKAALELVAIAEQLSSLMKQFKIERGDRRIDVSLPVALTAVDAHGHPSEQEVMTVNVSRHGIQSKLQLGGQGSLARLYKQEQFLVSWVGEENTYSPDRGLRGRRCQLLLERCG